MTLTKPDGSPAPKYLRVSRTWTYDVEEAAEALAEFSDGPVSWDDVYQLILGWIPEDVREPVGENLPAIEEIWEVQRDANGLIEYDVTEVSAQNSGNKTSHP